MLDLQDEAQDIFDLLRVDQVTGYASHAALTRQMLHLLAGAYGIRIQGEATRVLQEMVAPGTMLPNVSPWKLGRLPG